MAIETTRGPIGDDDRLTLSQAAATLPGHPHLSTLQRWRLHGVRGVKLRTELVGGRRYTTRGWLREFCAATTVAGERGIARPNLAATLRCDRSARAAEAELDRAGL